MKENATYTVISEDKKIDVLEAINCGGIIKDQIVELSLGHNVEGVRLRLVNIQRPSYQQGLTVFEQLI